MLNRKINLPTNQSFFLFGPRQTGKSTLLRTLFPERSTYFFDLLKSEEYLRLSAHPQLFREEVLARDPRITHVVVDEVQRIPEILSEVHLLMESPKPPHFILTGSSARKLKRSKADLLAGRALTFRLFPFTAGELGSTFSLQKALRLGTMPSVYLEESADTAMDRLRSYVETYLKEEIELEAQVRQVGQFNRFLTLAGFENGNALNFSNIARETGTSYQTVKAYFQVLEDTLIGQFLYPYLKSERKRLSKHPKFYFFDLGITRALTKQLSVPVEPRTPEFGRLFEHFVILETLRQDHYRKLDLTFSYYRTEQGAEVDLIIETPRGKIMAVEIKGSDVVDSSGLRGLKSFAEIRPEAELFCASLVPRKNRIGNVSILPWQDLMEFV